MKLGRVLRNLLSTFTFLSVQFCVFGCGLRFVLCVASVLLSQVAKPIEKKPDRKSLQTVEIVGLDFTTSGVGGDLAADLTRLQAEAEESYYGPAGGPVPGAQPPVDARTLADNAERLSRKRGDVYCSSLFLGYVLALWPLKLR